MTDRTTNLILKATTDQSAAADGVRALQQLQAASDGVVASFSKINETDAANNQLRQQFIEAADAIQTADDKLKQFIADQKASLEQQALSPTAADFGGGADSGGGLGGVTGLRRTGSALNQLGLGEIGRPVQLLGDLEQVVKEVGVASEAAGISVTAAGVAFGGVEIALAPLLPLLAAITAVVTAAIVIYEKYSAAEEQHKKDVDNGIATLDAYYGAIVKGTTATIQAQIELDQANLAAKQAELADIQKQINTERGAGEARPTGVLGAFSDLGKSLGADVTDPIRGKVIPAFGDLQTKATELEKQITADQNSLKGLNEALSSTNVAVNDAIEAEKKLQAARDQAADQAITDAAHYAQLRDTGTSKGVQTLIDEDEVRRAAIQKQLADSSQLSAAETKKLTDELNRLIDDENKLTGDILPAVKAREDEQQAAKDATKAFDEFTKSMSELGKVTAEIAKLEADRAKQVAQEQADDARNAQRASIEKDYQTRIDAAKREEAEQAERDKVAQADADALTKYNDDKAKIVANEFDGELKAYQNYIDAEKRQTDQANRQRLQTLESAQNDLKNLAAAGDVAGFVQRSDQAKLDLKHQAEGADDQQKQLYDNYEKQVQAARDAGTKQLNDLQVTVDREKTVRDAAAADRIAQIEESGKEANTKSAQLERELNDIREQWRRDDLQRQRDLEEQSYEDRLRLQQDKQREILAQTGNFFEEWINDIAKQAAATLQATAANNAQSQPSADDQAAQTASDYLNYVESGGDQTFATGLDYVPRNNYRASLDLGERVLTAQQNREYTDGGGRRGGGDTYQVTVQNTVGDVATQSMLEEYQNTTVAGIRQALRQAKGRGSN